RGGEGAARPGRQAPRRRGRHLPPRGERVRPRKHPGGLPGHLRVGGRRQRDRHPHDRDGVLVVFHDDMLDRLLEAYGDVSEVTWAEPRQFTFREPGRFGAHCRIPTLVEVFDLHRKHAGLLHLDVKRPGLEKAIIALLDRMDLWDHVAHCNAETAPAILRHPKFQPRRYKAGLYLDHAEVDPAAIAAALKKPGDDVIVDDPRGVVVALGRKLGKVSA